MAMLTHTCSLSTQEAKARGLCVLNWPKLYSNMVSEKVKQYKKFIALGTQKSCHM